MVDKRDESRGENSPASADEQVVCDRVQELTWALLDERIKEDECRLLENLLLSDDKARDCYIKCIQLHTALMAQFAGLPLEVGSKTTSGTQILGLLSADLPPLGFQWPSAEEATK